MRIVACRPRPLEALNAAPSQHIHCFLHRAYSGTLSWIAIQAACAAAIQSAQCMTELTAAIELLKKHHLNAGKVDWVALEKSARAMIGSEEVDASYAAIRFLIAELGEKHTFLVTVKEGTKMLSQPASSDPSSGMALPEATEIESGIGYLGVYGTWGSADQSERYARRLREQIESFRAKGMCKFVVDLRENLGGNMWAMLNGLRPLLGQPPFGHFSFAEDKVNSWGVVGDEVIMLEAGVLPQASNGSAIGGAKVAVLVGPKTNSAGEGTTVAFRGAPGSRIFGKPTFGNVSVNQGYALPDNSSLVISIGYYIDRTGTLHKEPIVPDVITPDLPSALSEGTRWLRDQTCSAN